MSRRKKNSSLNVLLIILLIICIFLLVNKYYEDHKNVDGTKDTEEEVINNKDNKEKENVDTNNSDNKKIDEEKKEEQKEARKEESNSNETIENKNENTRRGGHITIELVGEEEVTISKGSKYKDPGVKAIYDDGSDASSEIEIDNTLDTSKAGTYTISYYAGNTVVIRRVTVK